MKKIKAKRICASVGAAMTMALMNMPVFAQEQDMEGVANKIADFLKSLFAPMIIIVGAVGMLYCVLLGVNFAKAEEPQDREKAKTHLKNAIIGYVLIFILVFALTYITPILINFANS